MMKRWLYITPLLKVEIKQYQKGSLIWIFGLKNSLKWYITNRKHYPYEYKYNYIWYKKLYIEKVYSKWKVKNNKEESAEKNWSRWVERKMKKMAVCTATGFKKYLRVRGVGYKFELEENNILGIDVGYSYKLRVKVPLEHLIKFSKKQSKMKVKSIDLQQLGEFIAKLRSLRVPDSYKGKGIRYLKERKTLKEGKKEL